MSPARTSRAGLAVCPLDSIRPSSQARDASDRVLKNRAAQSHLSILMPCYQLAARADQPRHPVAARGGVRAVREETLPDGRCVKLCRDAPADRMELPRQVVR